MAADALANLARIGQLKVEARNPAEVLRMLKQAKTRLADAQLAHVSVDGRFDRDALRRDAEQSALTLRGAEAQVEGLTRELGELGAASAQDKAGMQAALAARDLVILDGQAAQQLLTLDLQAKIEALAAAQPLAEQCRAQAVELESENGSLLLQMHQVQEELDQPFLENQRSHAVMGRSRQARHLISHLTPPTRNAGLTGVDGVGAEAGADARAALAATTA